MFPSWSWSWAPAAVVAVAVLAASVARPESVAGLWEVLPLPGETGDGGAGAFSLPADKLGHLTFYAVLAAAAARAALRTRAVRRPLLAATAAAFAYGLGIELLQSQLPYRSMEALDAVANAAGAAAGAGAVGLLRRARAGNVGGGGAS